MRISVMTAAVAASMAAVALLPGSAHALSAATLTICAQGAHADVLVAPASTAAVGPASFSIANGTCSDFTSAPGTYTVSLAQHGRTPCYGPSTANDGGNFGFCEQPFDHTTVKYTALPAGGMSANYDDSSVSVTIGAPAGGGAAPTPAGPGAEVDFVFQNQLH